MASPHGAHWSQNQPPAGERPLALVTGGARRVGRAICLELARAGCDVLLTFRTSEREAVDLADAIASMYGAQAGALRLDLADPLRAAAACAAATADLRRLDVLVHNAAIYGPTPLGEIAGDQADRFWRVNALAPLLITQALATRLRASALSGGGAVVCLVDAHALGAPRRRYAPYLMSKAALAEMVRDLARELAPAVRVTGLAPSVVAFPEQGEDADPDMQRRYLARVPLQRSGAPEDAARAVRFLALEATYMTGEILRLDGGRSLT